MISTEVQKAIYDALTAAPAVAGGKVFDATPDDNMFPRVTIGEEQILGDSNSCGDGWEVFADVHVWSRAVGFPESKTIAAQVAHRVKSIQSVNGHSLISVEHQDSRALRQDGNTSHIVLTFAFLIDEA